MQTPEEFASEIFDEHVHWGMQEWDESGVLEIIRTRDAEVRADERAKVLAGFTRKDVAPFFGHGHTSPGYWRLVGPKHYKPIPTPEAMSQEAIDELRRRLTAVSYTHLRAHET